MRTDGAASPDAAVLLEARRGLLDGRPLEDRLLVAVSRVHLDEGDGLQLERLLGERIDWERFVARAEWHRVAPLAYRTLLQPPFDDMLPAAALQRLRGRYLANGVANRWRLRELNSVVAALAESGIVPILLKGAALVHTVYPDPALRQMSDLDLLVPRKQLPEAERRLLALGYEPAEEEWPPGCFPPEWYEKKYRHRWPEGRQSVVELHWGLTRPDAPFQISVPELVRASVALSVGGLEARVLSPVHQLLHICTHLAHNDGFGVGLSRLVDLHEAVESFRERLDWESLAREARRFRTSLCLRYSLAVGNALLGTPLPAGFLEAPQDPPLRPALAAAALERVLGNDRDQSPLPDTLAKLLNTDRTDLAALLRLLLARPRHLKHCYRLLYPTRLLRALGRVPNR